MIQLILEGKCHPRMSKMFFERKNDNLLEINKFRTIKGSKRFSIAGAIIFNEETEKLKKINNQQENYSTVDRDSI